MSLRKRIQILLVFLVFAPMLIVLFETARSGRQALLQRIREESLQIAELQAAHLDLTFQPARQTAEAMAHALETAGTLEPAAIKTLMRDTLERTPSVYGVCVALVPGATPGGKFAPYLRRGDGKTLERDLAVPTYQYTLWGWFRQPVDQGRGLWSPPYQGSDVPMITFSAPIRRGGRVVGVAAVDLTLADLIQRVDALRPGGNGTVYLVNKAGQILVHPALKPIVLGPGEGADPKAMAQLKSLIDRPGTDTADMLDPVSRRRAWVVEWPVRSMAAEAGGQDWSVIVSWPLGQRLAPVFKLGERLLILFLFLGGGALLFLNRAFDQLITRPVAALAHQARSYAEGDFSARGPIHEESRELEELSAALAKLREALDPGGKPAEGMGGRAV